ncbi:Outer membrane receptor proteins, mostly Fe transport [Dyadobacter soli]|uniref:Outer membrane receptor proteins, mostly Fe transport n=1 Tax=Dyadobacter soli TaxID=659014 RepID=A0A1G7C532_9BACT|nr:TonB-dependent receptor [Dyadobacter soli]SDE34353.1 Outer membrane receptor proteins, mostly Fe transport [Dyadobacter soli]
MNKYLLGGLLLLISSCIYAQRIAGSVNEQEPQTKNLKPITGANVYWAGTTQAAATDENGRFSIPRSAQSVLLVVSFVGFRNDTIKIGQESELQVVLQNDQTLDEVTVRAGNTSIDRVSPHQTEIITTRALAKAACCNLSESFETNASVSVSYADAVTGSKQIQMLGLNGTYIQTNVENIPSIRGLASTFGLNFVPGTWIQSIDVGKGAGSVVNGYESMTGQINVELQKPDTQEKLYLNTYVNNFGRGEVNLNLAHQLNKKWSTGLLTHGSTLRNRIDKNGDGFLDLPLYTQYNAINRWKYQGDKLMAQFGVKALYEDRLGGQKSFEREMKGTTQAYGFGAKVNRYEFFSKIARLFPEQPYKGLGLILNASIHDSKSHFGLNNYDGTQKTLYGNLIYQSIIGNTNHSYKAGISYMLDNYDELYKDIRLKRNESVPGAFFEYTYNHLDKFVMVAGGRVDFHNLYGTQWTPRLHLKYSLTDQTTLRASAGRGFRVSNPLAEYYGNLVSSRNVLFREAIRPEVSWNYGASITQEFKIGEMSGNFIMDFYRTDFENQLVADMEDPRYIRFYNLEGKAYANSFQAEANLTPIKRLELKLAYRLFDVKQTIRDVYDQNTLQPRMMVSRDRVLFNAGYALPYDKWKFDATVQWNGKKRLPYMGHVPDHHVATDLTSTWAPSFYNFNAQITRTFPKWDIYLGGENLANFRQKDPIMGASEPFGQHFDAGMAWGPVAGRMIYAGMRYKIVR